MRYCQVNCVRAAGSRQVALCSSRVSFRVIFIKCITKWIKCCAVLCHAVLCHAVQCCAVLCHAVQCCVVLCHAVLCCAVLCYAMLCSAVLCCAVRDMNDTEWVSVVQCCASLSKAATLRCLQQQATNPGPSEKEPRANRNVTTKTVSAEPLAVEDPSAGGWAGYSQQIR